MSSAVERPNTAVPPTLEKSFEELCEEWLQLESSPRLPPQQPFPASTDLVDSDHNTSLWLDIQEWALPLSPRLLVSDVQSPGALRPYGTPLATERSVARQDDCYFSFQPYTIQNPPLEVIQHTQPHVELKYTQDSYRERSSVSTETYQSESSKTPNFPSNPGLEHVVTEPEQNRKKRKLSADDPIRIKSYGESPDQTGGVMIEWGKPPSRRSRMDNQRKLGYRDTRKKGACENCKRGRRRCDRSCHPYIECLKSKPLIFLDRPVAARLFRLRPSVGHPLASEKPEIYALHELSPSRPRVLTNYISQGIGGSYLPVQLCMFEPHPDLKTSHVYNTRSAGRQHLELPPYCLANVEEATMALDAYIKGSWCRYLQTLMLNMDQISRDVLRQAQKYAINHSERSTCLVRRALTLLAVNRMIELNWTFVGEDDVPGVYVVGNPENPWYGRRPITPVMDTQLDQIIIQTFLTPLRAQILQDLQEKIDQRRKRDCFEIFLTVFILQTNTALLLRHSNANAIKCGAGRRYNSIPLAQEYIHSSNILLAHFHHGYNGLAGLLSMSSGKSDTGLAREHEDFLNQIVPQVHARKDNLMNLRSDKQYEADLFWTHQMFFEGWVPEDRTVAEIF